MATQESFYQACWDIIANDMTKMEKSFFWGHKLPIHYMYKSDFNSQEERNHHFFRYESY